MLLTNLLSRFEGGLVRLPLTPPTYILKSVCRGVHLVLSDLSFVLHFIVYSINNKFFCCVVTGQRLRPVRTPSPDPVESPNSIPLHRNLLDGHGIKVIGEHLVQRLSGNMLQRML